MLTLIAIIAIACISCCVLGGFAVSGQHDQADDAAVDAETTRLNIVKIRRQQREVEERNLATRLRCEMRRGRVNQVALIYREFESCGGE